MQQKILPPTYLLFAILAMILLHFIFPLYQAVALPWNLFGLIPLLLRDHHQLVR